ncbi:MAG: chemotaxis protein CheC [Promethearchaeota archaeon]
MESKDKMVNTLMEKNEEIEDRYIVFRLNDENIAIGLQHVQEVIDVQEIRTIPKLEEKFSGIYNLRNEIIPIINFSFCIFGASNKERKEEKTQLKVVILTLYNEVFGILVDVIEDIIKLSEEHYKQVPSSMATKVPLKYIENIAQINEKSIIVFDLKNLMEVQFALIDTFGTSSATRKLARKEILELDSKQTDALKEISNIATGQSMIALSKMLKEKKKINFDISNVEVKDLAEGGKDYSVDQRFVGIRAIVKNDMNAAIFLIFPVQQLVELLHEIALIKKAPKKIDSIKKLDKNSLSAIEEVGNIIISHYCAAISDFLRIDLFHEVPEVSIGDYSTLIEIESAKLTDASNKAVFIQTLIAIDKKKISGEILFIPYMDSINKFIKWLDADHVVTMMDKRTQIPSKAKSKSKTKSKSPKKGKTTLVADEIDEDQIKKSNIFEKVRSQKDYKLEEEDMSNLQINDDDLDAFRELGNIGAGHAGNALSQMLNKKVLLEIPPAKVSTIPGLVENYARKKKKLIGYIGTTEGFFQGNIFLMFPTDGIETLLQLIMETSTKKKIKNESDLDDNDKSAVTEILNILMGHYVSAMSNFLKVPIAPPEYTFFFKQPKVLFEKLADSVEDKNMKAIIVETVIKVDQAAPITGQFILVLSAKIVGQVIKRMESIY